jgi:tetratricopeptide (TPR) repeat protein
MRRLAVVALLLAACGPTTAPDAALDAAREAAACGRLDEAREALDALAGKHSTDARVALLAGEVATWRGFPEDGLEWFRRAAEQSPDDPEPHLRIAYVLLVHPPDGVPAHDGAVAEAALALADAGGVESAAYRSCRGEAAWAADDAESAEHWFRGALDLQSDCRWALHRLLQIAASRGDDSERAALNERLTALIQAAGERGHGMENARMPVSFCGH